MRGVWDRLIEGELRDGWGNVLERVPADRQGAHFGLLGALSAAAHWTDALHAQLHQTLTRALVEECLGRSLGVGEPVAEAVRHGKVTIDKAGNLHGNATPSPAVRSLMGGEQTKERRPTKEHRSTGKEEEKKHPPAKEEEERKRNDRRATPTKGRPESIRRALEGFLQRNPTSDTSASPYVYCYLFARAYNCAVYLYATGSEPRVIGDRGRFACHVLVNDDGRYYLLRPAGPSDETLRKRGTGAVFRYQVRVLRPPQPGNGGLDAESRPLGLMAPPPVGMCVHRYELPARLPPDPTLQVCPSGSHYMFPGDYAHFYVFLRTGGHRATQAVVWNNPGFKCPPPTDAIYVAVAESPETAESALRWEVGLYVKER